MRRLRAALVRLAAVARGSRLDRDFADEIESHLQLHIEDNLRAGMTPEEARRTARLKFGSVDATRESYRERAGVPIVEILQQDVRQGLRRIRRQPAFTALIVVILALGVGANGAMFGLVDVLMFRTPAHVPAPDRIVRVTGADSYPAFQQLRERLRSIETAAYARHTVSAGAGPEAESWRIECVTPAYFQVLGVAPSLGRAFTTADDRLGAGKVVVLSHAAWERRFAGAASVLGHTTRLADRTFEIIGVARDGFTGVGLGNVDAWILLTAAPEACTAFGRNLLRADSSWLTTFGRLQDGVELDRARAELGSLAVNDGMPANSRSSVAGPASSVSSLYASRRISLDRDSRLALWLAGGAVVLLLLTCANVCGLLWTHALDRSRELGIRVQLGAGRRRVAGQLLVEYLIIGALGGGASVVVAAWLGRAIQQHFPLAATSTVASGRALAFLAVVAITATVASGAIPATQAARRDWRRHLRVGQSLTASRSRARSALLSMQIALAVVLVIAAGLFAGSVDRFRRDFSYDLDRVIAASIDFRTSGTRTPQEIHDVYDALLQRVRHLAPVESAALSSAPVLGSGGFVRVFPVARTLSPLAPPSMHWLVEVSPEYFDTLGLSLSGQGFESSARPPADDVVVLDDAIARALFPGEDPLGQCVFVGRQCREIVGVSPTVRASRQAGSSTSVFVPLSRTGDTETTPQVLLVRTRGPAAEELPTISAALQGARPDLPFVNVRTLLELADVQARSWLLGAKVFGLFGSLAVALAAIGIYGALAFTIRRRTIEIGLRLAVGATRSDIARMVLRVGARVVVAGLAVGLASALLGSKYLERILFNVAGIDVWTFAAATLVVIGAALLGCLLPAIRAARLDPVVALRAE